MSKNVSGSGGTASFKEYKLKTSSGDPSLYHHVMTMSTNSSSISTFAPPVRLYRDSETTSPVALETSLLEESLEEPSSSRPQTPGFRRKSKIVSQDDDFNKKQMALLGPDVHSWVLEDGDGEHKLIGKREVGQQSHYVFFVNNGNDGNNFSIIPVTNWYRFAPKSNLPQITLEQAEALMAGAKKKAKFPSQSKPKKANAAEEEGRDENSNISLLNQLKKSLQAEPGLSQASLAELRNQVERKTPNPEQLFVHADELDYEEVFEDDEEVGFDESTAYGEADDPSAPVPFRSSRTADSAAKSLSSAGKDLRRIVQSHDKGVVEEDSEDEDFDPSPKPTPSIPQLYPQQQPLPPGIDASAPDAALSKRNFAEFQKGTAAKPPPKQPQGKTVPLDGLSEENIIAVLKKGPVKTKDLIHHFRNELKEEANKTLFKEIIKRVAAVSGAGDSADKTLVLKNEYR
jgi:hypothetical protein